MRFASIAIAAMLLAGCQQADPAGEEEAGDMQLQATPNVDPDPAGAVRLTGDGVAVTGAEGTTLAFDSPRDAVEAELTRVLGEPVERVSNQECGAGPVETTSFAGGLSLNFQDERLAGWVLDNDDGAQQRDIATADRIAPGSSEVALTAAYDLTRLADSTLGDEFTTEDGISGFLETEGEEARVGMLYAGTTCFFR